MTNFTQEQLEAARAAKSPEELIEMAKESGIEITREQAEGFLSPPIGELADEELENVTGGGCGELAPDIEWGLAAQEQGYYYRIGIDCPNCHATSNGDYSLFSKEYKEYIDDGILWYRWYKKVKCFNCGTTFKEFESGDYGYWFH